ncbi:hypothetical protein [Nodularia sp. NIES-3585]|uniref:hypothetical protein n=1 Tax=Nodularia sp. NIES-3585 TaxID=1973477 RepID=UPI000B5CFD0E|nr:hypothetical protein [Nodularia sp. NIES-3585]GAX35194.1 hypothetical protein NIES3585_12010 [Nodularia sp. NIES-3585]
MFKDLKTAIENLIKDVRSELDLINELQAEAGTVSLVSFRSVDLDKRLRSRQKNIKLFQLKSGQISEDINLSIVEKNYITASEGEKLNSLDNQLKMKMSQLEKSYEETQILLKQNLWVAILDLFKEILGEIQQTLVIISSWAIKDLVQRRIPGFQQIFAGFRQLIGIDNNRALPPGQ